MHGPMLRLQKPPKIHHYIPCFYTKRWADPATEKLVEYFMPYRRVLSIKDKAPGGTGYREHLYSLRGLPPDEAAELEKVFFGGVDHHAARILEAIEERGVDGPDWAGGDKTHWTRFVMAMNMRNPQEIDALRKYYKLDWLKPVDELEHKYAAIDYADKPPTLKDYLAAQPDDLIDRNALLLGKRLMDLPRIGQSINNMHWAVLGMDDADRDLLTSDRPLMISGPLSNPRTILTMPVGPRRLFVATNGQDVMDGLLKGNRSTLARKTNRGCVERAVDYVYARDRSPTEFVKKYFGRVRTMTLIERMRANGERRQGI